MFWTDRDQKVIMRARFNGTEATTLVSSGLGVPGGFNRIGMLLQ